MNDLIIFSLGSSPRIFVKQVRELAELVGFETRNKYQILDHNKQPIAYAAEQQKGIFSFFLRQYLGHWRKFDIHFFTSDKTLFLIAHHPFRWFFQRLEVRHVNGDYLGAIQKRFSLLSKRFDIENEHGRVIFRVSSPIWRIWTFKFMSRNRMYAQITKKWTGAISEVLTDKDNFMVEFTEPGLSESERRVIMAAAIFIDLQYFENAA